MFLLSGGRKSGYSPKDNANALWPVSFLSVACLPFLDRGFKQDMIACLGEFVGTTMFIFLGLGCVKTAQVSRDSSELQTTVTLSNQSLVFISLGMGFSLLITAWVFYRITGGLFVRIMGHFEPHPTNR